jgi:HlyD family secretion protein
MKKRVIPVLILAIAVAAVAWWWFRARGQENTGQLKLYGNVDIREVNLGFRISGRLVQVRFDEGDAVEEGAEVARLDAEPYRLQVEEAEAQLAAAKARAALLEAGYRTQEVTQARAVVREREVTFENADRVYRRQQELLSSRSVSVQDRDDAEARAREAEARLKSAREQLALLEAGFRTEEIAQAKADVQRAAAALASAQVRLQDTVLVTPSAGVVITRAVEPGAIVQAGTSVLTVSLKRPVWVRAYVGETDLGKLHPGKAVRVYTDSHPDRSYEGTIGYISPRAEFTPRNVETPELRTSLVYRLRVVISNPDEGLRQGMPVTAIVL